ncbi:hypothetical protein [Nocardiopsis sp. NPDC006832]|uniref:hypothetical protein n=1 Tax=Nocardiopsis sp. NPDC006832 TaxID=3157188 RepID=UPI0033DD1317
MTNIEPLNCASPRCVLGQNHGGAHTEHTEPFVVNACAAQLHRLLTSPGPPCGAVATLNSADNVFTTLDSLLRAGAPLPSRWVLSGHDGDMEPITRVYDALSEALRETGESGETGPVFTALREACRHWRTLEGLLCAGSPLPEPWRRA